MLSYIYQFSLSIPFKFSAWWLAYIISKHEYTKCQEHVHLATNLVIVDRSEYDFGYSQTAVHKIDTKLDIYAYKF